MTRLAWPAQPSCPSTAAQFGMLIEHMAELRPEGLGEEGGKDEDVADLMELYRAAKKRFDEDEGFKTRSREAVTRCALGAVGPFSYPLGLD